MAVSYHPLFSVRISSVLAYLAFCTAIKLCIFQFCYENDPSESKVIITFVPFAMKILVKHFIIICIRKLRRFPKILLHWQDLRKALVMEYNFINNKARMIVCDVILNQIWIIQWMKSVWNSVETYNYVQYLCLCACYSSVELLYFSILFFTNIRNWTVIMENSDIDRKTEN